MTEEMNVTVTLKTSPNIAADHVKDEHERSHQRNRKFGRRINKGIRFIVVIVSIVFAICGFGAFVVTCLAYGHPVLHQLSHALGKLVNINLIYVSSAVLGIIMSLAGILGAVGATRRNDLYVGIQVALVLVILLAQAAMLYAFSTEWHTNIFLGISFSIHYYHPKDPDTRHMDAVFKTLKCCGGSGPSDFNIANERFNRFSVPHSCCNPSSPIPPGGYPCEDEHSDRLDIRQSYKEGCTRRFHEVMFPGLIGISAGLGGVGVIVVIFSSIYCILNQNFPEDTPGDEEENRGSVLCDPQVKEDDNFLRDDKEIEEAF